MKRPEIRLTKSERANLNSALRLCIEYNSIVKLQLQLILKEMVERLEAKSKRNPKRRKKR